MASFGNGNGERRFEANQRRLSSAAVECIDLADEHLRAIELAAAATVEDLVFEREALADELGPAEREQVEEIFDAVIEHGRQVAARCSRLRRRSRRARSAIAAEAPPAELIAAHSSREVVELRFNALDHEDHAEALRGIGRLEVLPDRLLLYVDDGDAALVEVHGRGVVPDSALIRRSTLEDVFLRLTGRELVD